MLSDDLFSIDAAAHLRKVADHTFRLPAYYPVEWVRAALGRGARRIDIHCRRGRMDIRDDGAGVAPADVHALHAIFGGEKNPLDREQAIAGFVTAQGIGLLSMFAGGAERVDLESEQEGQRSRFEWRSGTMRQWSLPARGSGSQLRLRRAGHSWDDECRALRLYCRFVGGELRLNGAAIGGGLHLPQALASLRLERQGMPVGIVGIPAVGHFPCLWLLDHGVCWERHTLPVNQGLVWEAAVETTDGGGGGRAPLDEAAARLYRWLADHWADFPAPARARIEDLLFDRLQQQPDEALAATFRPFAAAGRRLSLTELAGWAKRGGLDYSLADERAPVAGELLVLSRRQADFLLNHMRLPLRQRLPERPAGAYWEKVRPVLQRCHRRLFANARRLPRPLPDTAGDARERGLMRALEEQVRVLPDAAGRPLRLHCQLAEGRCGRPATLRIGEEAALLLLRRRHRLVRLAAAAVGRDPALVAPAAAMLLPERNLIFAEGASPE